MYSITRIVEKENTVLSISHTMELMNSMYNEMFKKFGDISLDDMRFIVPVHEHIRRAISYVYNPMANWENGTLYFAGVEVLININLSQDTIRLVYREDDVMPIKSLVFPKIHTNPHIEKVIFNKPATIVFWSDDTKTVVKCEDGDVWNEEKGLAMAVCKKMLGLKEFYKQYNKATSNMWENINI